MEEYPLRFILNGVEYRISSHVWRDHADRDGLIEVEHIRGAIDAPDYQEEESDTVMLYWKWFPEFGEKGNYVRVVVNTRQATRLVTTAYLDRRMRKLMGAP